MSGPYQGVPNKFRADLRAGKRLIGLWSSLTHPITAEVAGLAGFDWIVLDGEHSPNDITTFMQQLMALKDSSAAPVGRPPWNDPVIVKRMLDLGFYNLIIPMIESAEQARLAVASTRYPPQGIRGVALSTRSNRYSTVPDYLAQINESITVLVQIETRKGVEAIDEIARVEGVDGIFVGPSDLAASYGHLGNPGHADVQAVMKHVYERALAAGKPVGTLAPVEADARRYMEWGATWVAVGSDLGLFRNATQALRDKFKQ